MITSLLASRQRPGLLLTAGPTPGSTADAPDGFSHLDEIGCSAIWMTDHLFWGRPMPEALTMAAVAAAMTRNCAIGTGVLQLPLRATASAAKATATIQELSKGRFILGVGVGEHEREYQLANADFAHRGRDLDRQIEDIRSLWAPTDNDWFVQRPAPAPPPIWVGGRSAPAIERAAHSDGWMPIFLSPPQYARANARLDATLARHGRSPDEVIRAVTVIAAVAADERTAEDARSWCSELWNIPPERLAKYLLVGSADEIVEGLAHYRGSGAAHISVLLATDNPVPMFSELLKAGSWPTGEQ